MVILLSTRLADQRYSRRVISEIAKKTEPAITILALDNLKLASCEAINNCYEHGKKECVLVEIIPCSCSGIIVRMFNYCLESTPDLDAALVAPIKDESEMKECGRGIRMMRGLTRRLAIVGGNLELEFNTFAGAIVPSS